MSRRPSLVSTALIFAVLVAGVSGPAGAAEAPTTLRGLMEAKAAPVDARVLRRLPSQTRSMRLAGETDALVWPVWVGAGEAAGEVDLRLALVAAVSVMPEASRLTVEVNGRPVGEFAIASGGGAKTVDLPLPIGGLRPGWNAVRVAVSQRHRVDCSIASTWELWTEIDPARSGLLFPAGHRVDRRDVADVAGLAPDEHGRIAVRLVMRDPVEPSDLERGLRAAQALAAIGGFLDPVVTVTRAVETGPGLDVVLGGAVRGLDGAAEAVPGTVALLDDGDPAHLVVAVAGDGAAIDRAIDRLVEQAGERPEGSEAGLVARAAVGGRPIASGERVRLADLGAESSEFSGRLFRTRVDVRLPADLYAADYAKVRLKLAGGHAAGLDRASRLTVRVNGRTAAGAPIVAARGEVFTDRTLQIPLSAFRPGHNRIEIEAAVPAAADASCDAAVQIDGPKRFLFVDRSELVFPTFARLARLPDLAATASGVLAALAPDLRPALHLPHPDRAGFAAAATFATRLAIGSGRIVVPKVVFRNPPADAASAIVVGAFADLPTTVVGAVGLDAVPMRAAWARRSPDRQAATPAADVLARRVSALRLAGPARPVDPIVTGSVRGAMPMLRSSETGDLVEQWRRSMESPWSPAAVTRQAGVRLEKLFDMLPIFGASQPLQGFAPTPATGLVVAQAMSPAGGVWTLVTAPTSTQLAETVATVTAGGTWPELEGAAVSWDRVEEKLATIPATHVGLVATTGFDVGNLRLVAAALASDYPFFYIFAALLVTAGLGFATARLLPGLGRARP